jgi:uncharacterized protein (DUF433 family)
MTDLRDLPTYSLTEAARYSRVSPKTLRTWLVPQGGLIEPAGRPSGISFWNLVEIWVLSAIRKDYLISMQKVRKSVEYVEGKLGIERPLIRAAFRTDGVALFVDHLGRTLKVSDKSGQLHVKELVDRHLTRVAYEEDVAASLYPFVRTFDDVATEQPKAILIDPKFGFGRPVLAGTGVRTDVIASRYRAGESHAALAHDYSIPVEAVEEAIRAELREAA